MQAEELNFTKAAARLHMVQQALSAQMRQLEDELGAELFVDPTGGVRGRLTDVALVWRPFDETGLSCEPLFTEERVAVLPADHPLARAKTIDAARAFVECARELAA